MLAPQEIARILLKEEAVFLSPDSPFTWTSGIKSPIYCDNRILISKIPARKKIIHYFTQMISPLEADVIAGTATAGIPWASWIAHEMNLPLIYVRSSSKGHGRKNSIEGEFFKGQKVILIEDLISTGKSSLEAALKLQEAELEIDTVMSIFSYNFKEALERFQQNNLKLKSLSHFDILIKVAYDNSMLNHESLENILAWRDNLEFPDSSAVQS